MGATIRQPQADVYVMRITGLLKKSELDVLQASAVEILEANPPLRVKLLILVEEFEGWERNPDWGDMSFYAEHGDKIAKIAIVGNPKWETEFKMFTGAGFRRGTRRVLPFGPAPAGSQMVGGIELNSPAHTASSTAGQIEERPIVISSRSRRGCTAS